MSIAIREASFEDLPQIVMLWSEFMKEHDQIVISADPKLKEFVAKDEKGMIEGKYFSYVEKTMKAGDGTVFIAEESGKLVGYILTLINDEIPIFKTKKLGYISDLYVTNRFRKKGISSKLRDCAIEWFKKKGINVISIRVYPANRSAHSIYKKWGFFDYHVEMRRRI
ncbi:MAG: GNAT family N-acetyltransferase [Candidatus Micrarchaeota archaeon]